MQIKTRYDMVSNRYVNTKSMQTELIFDEIKYYKNKCNSFNILVLFNKVVVSQVRVPEDIEVRPGR